MAGKVLDPVPTGGVKAIAFADHLHGLMNIYFHGQTSNSWSSILLKTSNGGRTWNRLVGAPELEQVEVLLLTPSEGWLYGVSQPLHQPSISTSPETGRVAGRRSRRMSQVRHTCETSGLPTFEDSKHGFLQMNGLRIRKFQVRDVDTSHQPRMGVGHGSLDRTVHPHR